jgi:hypothetical protein
MQERHGIAAVVFPSIAAREATFQYGVAKWDGAEQIITGGKSKFGAMMGPSGRYVGQLRALSLQLRFADLEDATLFEDYGGIHALSRFEMGRFIDLPVTQLFSDPAWDAKAVALAFTELTERASEQRR